MNSQLEAIGRRALLRRLGLGAAGLQLLSGAGRAQAQAAPPKRILFFYTENGTLQTLWKPKPVAEQSVATEYSFQLGDLHRDALSAHQKKLIYLETST